MSYPGLNPKYQSIDLSGVSSPPDGYSSGTIFYSNVSGLIGYNGSIWEKLDIISLSGMSDTDFSSGVTMDDILVYNGTKWVPSGGIVPEILTDLDDVSGTPSSGQYLAFNGTFWIPSGITPGPSTLEALNDVDLTSPQHGDYLVYNTGTQNFENEPLALALNDLTDVTLTSPATNSVLQYNGSVWIDSTDTIATGDSFLTLIDDEDQTAGFISGVVATGSLNTHNTWFFVATEVELETASRNVQFVFANAGTQRVTNYNNTYRRRASNASTDTNAATSNDTAVDCGGAVAWTTSARGSIMGWLTRYANATNGQWMGRIITQVAGGINVTETIFSWTADQTIDSIELFSTTTASTAESGRLKARLRLYKVN